VRSQLGKHPSAPMPIMSVSTLRPTLAPAGLRAPAAGPRGSKRPSAVAARGSSTRNHKSVAALGCGKSPVPPLVLQTLVAATAFSLCAALAVPDAAIAALSKPLPGSASVFVGEFSDPKHPGCLRSIGVGEESAFDVKGTDGSPGCLNGEKQRPWSLKALHPAP